MIVTVTLNPSLDRTLEVGALRRGSLTRATSTRLDAGGKGVNVARALGEHRTKARAVLPLGGPDGEQLMTLLASDGIDVVAVPVAARTRSNVSIVEPDGTVTKVNEPGAPLSAAEVDALIEAFVTASGGADWAVLCGSLPPGLPVDIYRQLTAAVSTTSTAVAVDTSGPALRSVLAARPALVKPNREELSEYVGESVRTLGDVVAAADALREAGAGAVLASLGADGAVLVDDDGALYGQARVAEPRSTVGAGDAMLAGFLAAGARGREALAEALAWGSAAVGLPGSRMPSTKDVRRDEVHVHDQIDRSQELLEHH